MRTERPVRMTMLIATALCTALSAAACNDSDTGSEPDGESGDTEQTTTDSNATCVDPATVSATQISLVDYYARLETVRNAISALPNLSASGGVASADGVLSLENEINDSRAAYQVISPLWPPDPVAEVHFELLNIMDGRVAVDSWIQQQTPANADTAEQEKQQYRTPLIGQFRIRLERANTALDRIAAANAVTVSGGLYSLNGQAQAPPEETNVLGSADAPVTEFTLESDRLQFADPGSGQNIDAPDLTYGYTRVFAKAGTIRMTYDNQNPAPFKHNAVVYRNSTGENLKTSEIVVGTDGGSGPKTQTVTFELPAGDYYVVCNVHLDLQKTQLTVVD